MSGKSPTELQGPGPLFYVNLLVTVPRMSYIGNTSMNLMSNMNFLGKATVTFKHQTSD